ncbi:trypsin-like peptidase domain-containing protein [Saccharopolyspora indica]|uniref:nSTAND1 domain-containing NTPase n=1 Tax=Saccharopolyspora indica TaxID=1229659 RepID=UPI0022EA55E1|nr:trypsin-like peptidase domain-containing protein [Saccharopolyspora indica]MDA3647773.1 trypsin-like peptidase domain-containing protein [Saccharopolyspora indica]
MDGLAAGPLDPALVRLRAGRSVLGAGFLIAPDVIATCAHVLDDELVADFPLLPSHGHAVEVLERDDELDVAILRLPDPPPGALPVPARISGEVRDHRFRTFGFPRDMPDGVWVTGRLLGAQGAGRIQMAVDPDHWHVEPGFSGAPVWDEELAGVVGMVVTVSARSGTTAHLVPTTALGAAWTTPARNPYRGLRSFREEDAELFHGRDADADRLFDLVRRRDIVAVAGPSGSGKSSLVRAGLVPKLKQHGSTVVYLEIGDEVPGSPAPGTVLVLDQFEETVVVDPAAAREKLAAVIRLAGTARTVLTLRSRSLDELITRDTVAELNRAVWFLEPMSRDQLAAAVAGPAAEVGGLAFESGLVQRILDDAEEGTLPLLSLVLDQLWQHRHGGWLTHEAYEKLGRLPGALSTAADGALATLSPHQRAAARRLLTLLTRPDGEGGHARRSADLADFDPQLAQITDALAAERLITVQDERVDLAHQALIDHWPTLRNWLAEDAEFLDWRAKLDDLRNSGGRLTGGPLAKASDWLRDRPEDIPAAQREFIRRSQRRARAVIVAVTAFALVAVVLAGVAWYSYSVRDEQLRANLSAQLAQQAGQLSFGSPAQALQLALAAWHEQPGNPDAYGALFEQRLAWNGVNRLLPPVSAGPVRGVQSSADGQVVVVEPRDFQARLVVGRGLTGPDPVVREMPELSAAHALSPDGRFLAVSGESGVLQLRDLSDLSAPPRVLGTAAPYGTPSFSANGRFLTLPDAEGDYEWKRMRTWDLGSGRELPSNVRFPIAGPDSYLSAFPSDDGTSLITAEHRPVDGRRAEYQPVVRNLATGAVTRTSDFSIDDDVELVGNGTHVVGCANGVLRIADALTGVITAEFPASPSCGTKLDVSGQYVLLDKAEGTEIIHPASGRRFIPSDPAVQPWNASDPVLRIEPDGRLTVLSVNGADLQLSSTEVQEDPPARASRASSPNARTPDGRKWVTYASNSTHHDGVPEAGDGAIVVQDQRGTELARIPAGRMPLGIAIDRSGERAAVLTDGVLRVHRTSDLSVVHEMWIPVPGNLSDSATQLVITGDRLLVNLDGVVQSWDVRTGEQVAPQLKFDQASITARPGHPDELLVQTAQALQAWDPRTWTPLWTLPLPGMSYDNDLHVSPDGATAVVLTNDTATASFVDLTTRTVRTELNGSFSFIHGISGNYLFTSNSEALEVWDIAGQRRVLAVDRFRGEENAVVGDAFVASDTPGGWAPMPLGGAEMFRDLCRISDREFTELEKKSLPLGASTERPCR